MMLQALNGYYQRLSSDGEKDIPVFGFGFQKIYFALLINKKGELSGDGVLDLRISKKKKNVPRLINVPQELEERAGSKIAPHFLWDNTGYALGADDKGKPEAAIKKFDAFKEFHHSLCDKVNDAGLQAILRFLDSWEPEMSTSLRYWDEMKGMQIAFMLDNNEKPDFIHNRSDAKSVWLDYLATNQTESKANCLVTGDSDKAIARLHPAIKGVRNAQTKGAAIISFNLSAFTSYGKTQSYNAPVSEEVAFAYTTALNYLLRPDSRQKIQIGDATTVFWTERDSKVEGMFGMLFDPSDSDNKQIRDFLEAVRNGKAPDTLEEPEMRFYILGLSPNASRLSVRFWHVSTVADICNKVGQHFRDLSIVKEYENNPDFPGMWQLFRETATLKKLDNVPPSLAGAFMRAILTGAAYPQSLLSAIITRIRSDQNVNYFRAAMIKAYIVRQTTAMEVKMGLDKESKNTAYRLGRLFAVLESIQIEAHERKLNKTIRDSYFGSASATPRAIFPKLIQNTQYNLRKIAQNNKPNLAKYFDRQIGEIVEVFEPNIGFEAHLSLVDQGMFALGYYHQKTYKKSKNTEEE